MDTNTAYEQSYRNGYEQGYKDCERDLRRHAHWERVEGGDDPKLGYIVRCSYCNWQHFVAYPQIGGVLNNREHFVEPKYCSHCGSIMDEEVVSE